MIGKSSFSFEIENFIFVENSLYYCIICLSSFFQRDSSDIHYSFKKFQISNNDPKQASTRLSRNIAQRYTHFTELIDLAINHRLAERGKFRNWPRAMRPGLAPSELVVSIALRQALPGYLFAANNPSGAALFILGSSGMERLSVNSLVA